MGRGRGATAPLACLLGIPVSPTPLRAQAPKPPATTVLPATGVE